MKRERTDIDFPMWRKKVDPSMWTENCTTIPNSYVKSWGIDNDFFNVESKKDLNSNVSITIKKTSDGFDNDLSFQGKITCAKKGIVKPLGSTARRKNPAYRFWWPDELSEILKKTYSMSYIRDIENKIRINKIKKETGEDIRNRNAIENEIPFWEFLDIEYDRKNRSFILVSYYQHKSLFPNLFSSLSANPVLRKLDNDLSKIKDSDLLFYQQDWAPIENYITEIKALNVIYMLYSKKNSSLYIGKADNLITRFKNHHMLDINQKNYDFYRYDLIPQSLPKKVILEIERMIIRIFQTTFNNKKDIKSINVANLKIDNSTKDSNR